jgi:predicted aspartyl protease
MNVTQEYNRAYEPPAPYLNILVSSITGQSVEEEISALLDSGADATMLPISILNQVKAPYLEKMVMRWGTSPPEIVDIFIATIRIGPHILHGINVIAMPPESEAILGRDVLNQLIIQLNGLALETTVLDE